MEDFIAIQKKYEKLRNVERNNIIKFLKTNGYTIIKERGGKGRSNYTSKNTLKIPYDLSNWKWIEAEKDNMRYLISLQAFDVDSLSGNHHVLMDRLGVYKYAGQEYNANEAFENMIITDIDLPMDNEKLLKMLEYLQ